MRALVGLLLVAAALAGAPVDGFAAAPARPAVLDPIFGLAPVFAPKDRPKSVIVLLSDANGFGRDEIRLAGDFVGQGSLVIGLNWPAWRSQLAQRRNEGCSDLLGHIETIVLRVERERGVDPFLTPIIAGVGLGGSAARALAPEVATHRIAGVVALRSSTFVQSAMPICGGIAHQRPDGYVYEAPHHAASSLMEADDEAEAAEAAEELREQALPRERDDLADLPLTVAAPAQPASRLVVLLTGDGGMGWIDQGLANALVARRIAVVALDSRRYFWTERDPAKVAHDLQRILKHFRREWPIEAVALVGYSFGADFLPLAYKHLSARTRRSVALVSLLALSPAGDLQIELNDADYPNAKPLLPDAAHIDAALIQCVYGEDDALAAMACPALAAARPDIDVHKQPGGHSFNGDVEALAEIVAAPLLAAPARPARAPAAATPAAPKAAPSVLQAGN